MVFALRWSFLWVASALDCAWIGKRPRAAVDATCVRLPMKEAAKVAPEDLAEALLFFPELRELHLSWLQLGDQRLEEIAQVFRRGQHRALERLYLAHNNLGISGGRAIASALGYLPHLKVLNLPENAIRAEGAEALAKALPKTPLLEQLVLAGNGLGLRGTQAIAQALPHLPHLQDLHLSRNALGTQGALALARVLYSGHGAALEWLSLSDNALGDVGLQALSAAVKRTPRLEWLDLEQNALSDLGAKALSRALLKASAPPAPDEDEDDRHRHLGCRLRELSLQKNPIGAEGHQWLQKVQEQLPEFQFWIDGRQVGSAERSTLKEMVPLFLTAVM